MHKKNHEDTIKGERVNAIYFDEIKTGIDRCFVKNLGIEGFIINRGKVYLKDKYDDVILIIDLSDLRELAEAARDEK